MKKNLAKRIVLGLLTGAVLMSSSVAWASVGVYETTSNNVAYKGSVTVGDSSIAKGADADACTVVGVGAYTGGTATNSVVLGFGSRTDEQRVVSVGFGGDTDSKIILGNGVELTVPNTRRIVNVAKGVNDNDAVNVKQLEDAFKDVDSIEYQAYQNEAYDDYAVSVKTLKNVLANVSGAGGNVVVKKDIDGGGSKTEIGGFSVQESASGSVTLSAGTGENTSAVVTFEQDKVVFGTNSSWYQEAEGFFAGGNANHDVSSAKAALKEDGSLMGASGAFQVDTSGNVIANNLYNKTQTEALLNTKANAADVYKKTETYSQDEVNTRLADKADKSALDAEIDERKAADQDLQSQIDQIGGGDIAGLNQRLEKTNAKINKVGAGAAALAALHPLDYDPDDKLTFSAGMGNYAGENAAALGAFYRPNEKFMLSLGGTMGNGENMVNLGLSIGLDKPNGLAKLSKKELIQKVNAVEAENDALEDRVAKLEALVAQLASK